MLRDEPLELADELSASAELEVGVDSLLQRFQPELLESADLALRKGLEGKVAERRAAPQRERLAQRLRTLLRVLLPRLGGELLEAPQIELVGLDPEQVARRLRHEDVGRNELAKLHDEVLERRRRRLRTLLPPELLDDAIAREQLAGVDQQEAQEGALLLAAKGDRALLVRHFERPEDAELEHKALVAPSTSPEQMPLAHR